MKIGDKVKIKENFWKIESGVDFTAEMKTLAGRTLEIKSVDSDGDFRTKQDDSNDNTSWYWDINWLELYNPIITWDTLKWKDVVIEDDDDERMVLDVRNDLVDLSCIGNFEEYSHIYHKKELQNAGYTIKQPTPPPTEKLELTLGQVVEKFVADITNIKIKK